jgi:multidrug resistance efflux pump
MQLRAPYLRGGRGRGGGGGDFQLVVQDLVVSGTQVKKGDMIARFDQEFMRNRFDNFLAELQQQENQVAKLNAQVVARRAAREQSVRVAKQAMDKAALDLKTAEVRSAIQAEIMQLNYDEWKEAYQALLAEEKFFEAGLQAEIRQAELNLEEAQLESRRAETNFNQLLMARAPMDGLAVVLDVFQNGQTVRIQEGSELRAGQGFVDIVDTSAMVLKAKGNQIDLPELRIGAGAQVRLDAFPDLVVPGRVYSISALAETNNDTGNHVSAGSVFLELLKTDARIVPDLTGSADVVLSREESDRIVPRDAVFHDVETGRPYAMVRAGSAWQRRELELGLADNLNVVVRSGLNPGETIAAGALPSGATAATLVSKN